MALIGASVEKLKAGKRLPVYPGAPAPGAAVFSDNFNRADGVLETSPSWTVLTGTAGAATVSSNALSLAGSGKTSPTIYTGPNTGSVDHFAEAVTVSTASINSFPIAVRVNPNGDYIGLRQRGATGYQVFQSVGGTLTQLGAAAFGTVTAGNVVRLSVSGNAVAVFINGVQSGSAVTTTLLTGTLPGIAVRGENVTGVQDNWRSGAGSGG